MPVDNLMVIDFVAISATSIDAILVISDHLDWDEKNEHMFIFCPSGVFTGTNTLNKQPCGETPMYYAPVKI